MTLPSVLLSLVPGVTLAGLCGGVTLTSPSPSPSLGVTLAGGDPAVPGPG